MRARREPAAGSGWGLNLLSVVAGLLVPLLVLELGTIANLIDFKGLTPPTCSLGRWIVIPIPQWLGDSGPVYQLVLLVLITFVTAGILSITVWLQWRGADRRARDIVRGLHERVVEQSLRRAEVEGAAAQRLRASDLIHERLPELQAGLALWYRVIPRSLLTALACVALAFGVHSWLAVVAVLTGYFLWRFLLRLRSREDAELTDWEIPRHRRRMADLVGRAPLLARLQAPGLTTRAFASETDRLYKRLESVDRQNERVWPLIFLAVAAAISILILGLGMNTFYVQEHLHLPAAMVLALALAAAALSVSRLSALLTQVNKSQDASDLIYQYLDPIGETSPSEQRVGLVGLRDGVEINGVSLFDSTGAPILESLSLSLRPGAMVSILGTEPISVRALAELLMGFGLPREGKISIDGIPLREVHPKALADNVMWIEPDGPIWDGSIYDNIRGSDESIHVSDVTDTLQRLDVYERLHRLPEGLSTIVSSKENDLDLDTTYAIGVTRAAVHQVPIVLVSEPPTTSEALSEDPCLRELRQMAQRGALVVVLPKRLATLRSSDRVVLLSGSRLAGEGTHANLLEKSDLYRHLNYLLFNPYRKKDV
ncbi:MAG: ABC transporter ATP-binding protein [Planctomycetota bacterium]